MFYRQLLGVFIGIVASTGTAFAAVTQVANISSGINRATGLQYGNAQVDPNYTIGAGGSGGSVGAQMVAVSQSLPSIYLPDNASTASRWIGINSGAGIQGITVAGGTFNVQTTVDLTGYNASTASMAGQYSVDDFFTGVQINGVTVYTPPGGQTANDGNFLALPANLGLGLFHSGVNTIAFNITNVNGPMALRFEGAVTAATPEPGVLGLVGFGVVTLMGRRRSIGHRR
jgi:hypothetical protein